MATSLQGYVHVCTLDALPQRGKKTFRINGKRVLVIVDDTMFYAVEDVSSQTGRSLSHGRVLDGVITSPNNGAHFDLKTGQYLGGGISPLGHDMLRVLPVKVVDDQLFVHP
jgi:nitrite reductase/ring-hydroxylating ferredoxin subunit